MIELEDNEAAFSVCSVQFPEKGNDLFVAIGTAKDMTLHPRRVSSGFIHLYKIANNQFQLVHKTPIEDIPYALCAYQGRLLAGIGKILRIYDMGKKKLLRKCENKNFPNFIVSLCVKGDRIIVGDVTESFLYVKYNRIDNQLYAFADHTAPRWLTTYEVLDYDTIAGADKFGML